MAQNDPENRLTGRQERAAALVATDSEPDERIAATCGIGRKTLQRWRALPAFAVRVAELRAAFAAAVAGKAIADRVARVNALDDRWRKMKAIIEERAADPSMAEVPGGTTGLLVRQRKALGSGDHYEVVDEYAVDTGLLRELREHEKQAAQELGQWVTKGALTNGAGQDVPITIIEFGVSEPAPVDEA